MKLATRISDEVLAFVADDTGFDKIYLFDVERKMIQPVTTSAQLAYDPAWLADGRLSYVSKSNGQPELYIFDWEFHSAFSVDNTLGISEPSWSVDNKVAFVSYRTGNSEIYVLNLSDGKIQNVSNSNASDISPSWSLDGKLAFVSDRNGFYDIVLLPTLTSQLVDIYKFSSDELSPTWLPNGSLGFISNQSGHYEVYTYDVSTNKFIQITKNDFYFISDVEWSSKGTLALAVQSTSQSGDILIIRNGKSETVKVNNIIALYSQPAWMPNIDN